MGDATSLGTDGFDPPRWGKGIAMESNVPVDPQQIADGAAEKNPDPTTRREAYELDLMEEGDAEVEAGRDVAVNEAESADES